MGAKRALLEERRLRARALWSDGWLQKDIAQALGVSEAAVSKWRSVEAAKGVEGLKAKEHPGPTPALTPEQVARIPQLLLAGAESFGFRGDVWTRARVANAIERTYGVLFCDEHVGRLLARCGWSRQKPIRRARQRNEKAIEEWRDKRWPALKKSRDAKGARSSS
jgi:transposase